MQCQQHPSLSHCVQVVLVLSSTGLVLLSPVQVSLQSQLAPSPIEGPITWAWGLHPDNGLDYNARDSLSVEVCLADMINISKCSLPCSLSSQPGTAELHRSGQQIPFRCVRQFSQLYSQPSCRDRLNAECRYLQKKLPIPGPQTNSKSVPGACAKVPAITLMPQCRSLLSGYQRSLFECQDNKSNLCSLILCDKYAFLCTWV